MFKHLFLLLPVIVCLVFAVLIFFKERRKKADLAASVAFFLSAIALFSYGYYYEFDYEHYYIFDIIGNYSLLLAIPTMGLYIALLTRYTIDYSKVLIFYLPAIVIPTFIMILYFFVGTDNSVLFTMSSIYKLPVEVPDVPDIRMLNFLTMKLYDYTSVAYFLCFTIDSIFSLRRYNRDLENFYSSLDTKKTDVSWLITWLTIIFGILCVTLCFGSDLNIKESPYVIRIIYLVYSVILLVMGRKMLNIKYTADDFLKALQSVDSNMPDSKEIPSTDLRPAQEIIDHNLIDLMEKNQMFLKKNLSLNDVALALNTNRSYASGVINKKYNKTFAEFVNQYRISFAQKLISENPETPLEVVADKSGFSTYMSFYRAFISIVGIPPKEIISGSK